MASADQAFESGVRQTSKEGIGPQKRSNSLGKLKWGAGSRGLLHAHSESARAACTLPDFVAGLHHSRGRHTMPSASPAPPASERYPGARRRHLRAKSPACIDRGVLRVTVFFFGRT